MTRSIAFTVRLAAAVLVTAAAGLGGVALAPAASAATCSTGSGVSVVVDFGELGGGVQTGCVPDGAGTAASSLFASAGFDLAYVQNEPGFVCRINGYPSTSDEACVNTPPEDAYWGLWWSDGTSGAWAYSNYGAGSLKVPDGAYVGFAWQTGSKSPPGVSPAPHPSAPTPSPAPTTTSPLPGGGGGGGGGPGHGSSHPSASTGRPSPAATSPAHSATPSASPTVSPTVDPTTTPSASPTKAGQGGRHRTPEVTPAASSSVVAAPVSDSSSPSAEPDVRSEVAEPNGGATLPVWVVPLVILVLGASASAVYVKRRRHRPSP